MLRRSLLSLVLVCTLATSACTGSAPEIKPTPREDVELGDLPIPKASSKVGDVRVITTLDAPANAQIELLGIDSASREAHVNIKIEAAPSAWHIDTYALGAGQRQARWSASPDNSSKLVGTYPRFMPVASTFEEDLAKYATLLRRSGPWSYRTATPPHNVFVSPDGGAIIYGTQAQGSGDGDWLMIADAQGQGAQRFDSGLTASYRVSVSPDSKHIAWMGGAPRFAKPGQIVGYVLHLGTPQGQINAIPAVRDVLRTPLWSSTSKTLFALGSGAKREQCLFAVDMETQNPRSLYCHQGQLDVIINPTNEHLLLLLHPWSDDNSKMSTLVLLDQAQSKPLSSYQVERPQGFGDFGYFVGRDRVVLFAQSASELRLIDASSGKLIKKIPVEGTVLGRNNTGLFGDELILLRRRGDETELIGVTVR